MKTNCTKKKYTYNEAIGFLSHLKRKGYGKKPWRNEVSYYRCEQCKSFHVSSKLGEDSKTLIKDKTYFEHQKKMESIFN